MQNVSEERKEVRKEFGCKSCRRRTEHMFCVKCKIKCVPFLVTMRVPVWPCGDVHMFQFTLFGLRGNLLLFSLSSYQI